ncbi:MerR family transcriptional regulator [Bacillus thuringiensis]|uniref:MerR family transcriptional regulator n=1 Tax=Bacillus cereus TaxID=1396 RepID=UPI001155DCC4|nr:MerR family transcriptional regulator [Bacillus cereus]MED2785022.1 MerR family transcriptional regulator [Bacillus thuringiensis]MED2802882.1 MerR family transcriptional regulator [Bacillus thuringiensis]MED2811541.1 MerR family transcriptional regulator [Bacillus thuringiensis]MED2827730.1 MerR family transcriptional regulator [Bacillus thuringiensis]MED2835150.1 MerR family transcriptional regulator [Bacillus thuringiensis]
MPNLSGKYNIKAVSNIIGVQPSTLRAWERRYQIIAPKRNQAGHRLYTEEHIQILKWLMEKVSSGMMIGQAVQLLEENRLQSTVQKEIHFDKEVVLVDDLLQALLKFDEITIAALLNEAFSIYSTEKVVANIVLRVTDKLLTSKNNNEISIVQFQYALSFLQTRLGMVYHNAAMFSSLHKVIVLEKNALKGFIFSTYLRLKGYEAIYIRTSLAEDGMLLAVEEIQPKYVFVSFADEQEMKKTMNFINLLQEKRESLSVGFIGKLGVLNQLDIETILIGDTKEEWDEWLKMSE